MYYVAMVTTVATGYCNCLVANDPLSKFYRSLQYIAVNGYTLLTHITLHHLPITRQMLTTLWDEPEQVFLFG